jgi:hypothetical protein
MSLSQPSIFAIWDQNTSEARIALQALASRPKGYTVAFADPDRQTGDLLDGVLVPGLRAADGVLVIYPQDDALVQIAFETGLAIGLGKPIAVLELRTSAYLLSRAINTLFGPVLPDEAFALDLKRLRERVLDPSFWHQIRPDAPGSDSTPLFLCPEEGIGSELRNLLVDFRPQWQGPAPEDAPGEIIRRAKSASRLLWVVVPATLHRQWGNVLAALTAGFYYGSSILRSGEPPSLEVLRQSEAPTIRSVERLCKVFEDLEDFEALLRAREEVPASFVVQKLEIRNFKNLEHLDLDFTAPSSLPGDWTCIAGINGAGKSSILEALSMVLLGEPLVTDLQSERLRRSLRRHGERRLEAEITVVVHDGQEAVTLYLPLGEQGVDRDKLAAHPGYPAMQALWNRLQDQVLVAYGASRNLSKFRDEQRYDGMSPLVRRVMTLFDPQASISSPEVLLEGGPALAPELRTLLKILETVLPQDLPARAEGDIQFPLFVQSGADVEAIELPDGFRSTVAWLADLCAAWHKTAPKEETRTSDPARITGIVLLDEIDLHLHPSLQRQLVPRLRQALPNVQFIVTTHSPLVLSSFDRNELVVLERSEESKIELRELDRQILGFSTNEVYQWLMDTPPQSLVIEKKLQGRADPELPLYLYQSAERNEEEARGALEERRLLMEKLRRLRPQ